MIWNLDPAWLGIAVTTVGIFCYVLGYYLDAIMPGDTFGRMGNMFILVAGFFGAIYLANYNYIRLTDLKLAILYGTGGALGLFLCLLLCYALVRRVL
ncbi:hypothetical protein [Limoniibacter endophyticus]|uniref:Uncharacterized protein n=1 Tax=Limoniibacter endophyticus TaxID=1565040 RepID=A0A8J3DKF1_9HYPH|nr:hypothetical protein [Limoniibacter endophyticus]GHC76237.1 hypothetical protein GCM10010136_26750 [Limoniibacter endophyticus]